LDGAQIIMSGSAENLANKKMSKTQAVKVLRRFQPIFIGKVVEAEVLKDEEPMTYIYYHEVKRGKVPKTAPAHIKEGSKKKAESMVKYKCKVCGYVYAPEKCETDSGIKSGTPFEKLPEDLVCPICGAGKNDLDKEE